MAATTQAFESAATNNIEQESIAELEIAKKYRRMRTTASMTSRAIPTQIGIPLLEVEKPSKS